MTTQIAKLIPPINHCYATPRLPRLLASEIGAHYVGCRDADDWRMDRHAIDSRVCALHEFGKLLKVLRRIALRLLETSNPEVRVPEEDLQPERGNAV